MAGKRTGKPAVKMESKLNYATPALEKGLDVLELLAHQPEGLTKSQIARELDRTVSEIFRMLLCLERRGYIALLGGERYSLTLKMFKLVQEHPPTERLIADALPVMHHLSQATLQSCHLGVLEDARVVILAQVNAPANIGFYVKLGSDRRPDGGPPAATSSSRTRTNAIAHARSRTGRSRQGSRCLTTLTFTSRASARPATRSGQATSSRASSTSASRSSMTVVPLSVRSPSRTFSTTSQPRRCRA